MGRDRLIAAMVGRDAADDRDELIRLTRALVEYRAHPGMEKLRFDGTVRRPIPGHSAPLLAEHLSDTRRVLVVGGTGCVGRVVLHNLALELPAAELSSFARRPRADPLPSVRYLHGDIRDKRRVEQVVRSVAPDLIVHLAAQRNPSLAEVAVAETVTTNLGGSLNVLDAAGRSGVPRLVIASTGKAVRFFTSDVYAATKKHVEYASAVAADHFPDTAISLTRFTHVVDNSIVGGRIAAWIARDEPIRLHSPQVLLPVQSALECYQLLMTAGVVSRPGHLTLVALRDLGWPPIDLLDLTLDHLAEAGRSRAPITFTGYPKGYEKEAYPGTYDPLSAGDVSPLLNCVEAQRTQPAEILGDFVDRCGCPSERSAELDGAIAHAAGAGGDDLEAHRRLRRASEELLAHRMASLEPPMLARIQKLGRHHDDSVGDHGLIHRFVSTSVEASS